MKQASLMTLPFCWFIISSDSPLPTNSKNAQGIVGVVTLTFCKYITLKVTFLAVCLNKFDELHVRNLAYICTHNIRREFVMLK